MKNHSVSEFKAINPEKFCKCALGNVITGTEALEKLGALAKEIDPSPGSEEYKKLEQLVKRIDSLCFCEQATELPPGERCPGK